jgi:hypothetical protein
VGIAMLATAGFDEFLAGLLIGVFLGLVLGPVLRSWLAWREYVEASREADLTERLLEHLAEEDSAADDEAIAGRGGPPRAKGSPA